MHIWARLLKCLRITLPLVFRLFIYKCFFVVQSPSHVQLFTTCGMQQARLPCPPPAPGVCPSSSPLNQWCHPNISSSDALFSFWSFQSFPALGSFPMSQLLASGGQTIGASASVLPKSIQGWYPLRLPGLISLLPKGLSRVFSSSKVWKHQFFQDWIFRVDFL